MRALLIAALAMLAACRTEPPPAQDSIPAAAVVDTVHMLGDRSLVGKGEQAVRAPAATPPRHGQLPPL